MRMLLSVLLATAVAVSATPAVADTWLVDGVLTRSEHQSWGKTRFAVYDANGDGLVNESEFTGLLVSDFDLVDLNRDGVLRRGELRGLTQIIDFTPYVDGLTRGQVAQAGRQRFAVIDVNNNQIITRDEFLSKLHQEFSLADINNDDRLVRGELRGLAPSY